MSVDKYRYRYRLPLKKKKTFFSIKGKRYISERKRAEDAFKKQNEILEAIINGIDDVLSIQNPDFTIERYNQAGYQMLNMTHDEIKDKKCYELIGRDCECDRCATRKALETKKVERVERYVAELGLHLECRSNPILDEDGNVVQIVAQLRDITKQKEQEKQLLKSEERYRIFSQLTSDYAGEYRLDADGSAVLEYQFGNLPQLTGYTLEELAARGGIFSIMHPDDMEAARQKHRQLLEQGLSYTDEFRIFTREGELRWLRGYGTSRRNEEGEVRLYQALQDITERKQAEEKVRYLSFHDGLTGLYNRSFLEEEMHRLDTGRQLPIGIIMTDLNGLKLVNDTYGHSMGDELLRCAAGILKESCRKEDIIARWGGDEFVVLLPQTSEEELETICRRISRKCRRGYVEDIPISLALGASIKDGTEKGIAEVLREAEDNMYKQKLAESRSARSAVLSALLRTLEEKGFQTEAKTGRMKEVALRVGERMGLPDTELSRLSLLITLHDIGKINISEEILTRKGPLTAQEWEAVKKHPETGYRIARATEEFAHVAEDILAHHERWDGLGYPAGLEGEEIPLLARITAVVDAYNAMTSERSYRETRSREEAVGELKRCAGTQFDPGVVEALLAVI